MTDNYHRSILKAISWRITGTLDTIIISFLITRRLSFAFSIGFIVVDASDLTMESGKQQIDRHDLAEEIPSG